VSSRRSSGRTSRYYADSLEEFRAQWELSSTWQEFEANQEQHKAALRSEMGDSPSVRVRASVRREKYPPDLVQHVHRPHNNGAGSASERPELQRSHRSGSRTLISPV